MSKFSVKTIFFCSLLLFCSPILSVSQESSKPLVNQDVIDLVKAGLSETVVVQKIHSEKTTAFDTSVQGLKVLKSANVPEPVIEAIIASSAKPAEPDTKTASASAPSKSFAPGIKLYLQPMNGFENYLSAAIEKKHVPVMLVNDSSQADFEVTGNAESQKAGWTKMLVMGSAQSHEEASISVANAHTGEIIFAYAVNKGNSVRGKQSAAEACAKHLKHKIEGTSEVIK